VPGESRERFVVALSKFLGENPAEDQELPSTCVCEPWVFDEALGSIMGEGGSFNLDLGSFNRLMLQCGRRMVSEVFFRYFFEAVKTLEQFEAAVDRFRAKAMWLFGNFRYALRVLGAGDSAEFTKLIARTEPVRPEDYQGREPFTGIEPIPVEDLHLLGYISRREIDDLDFALQSLELLARNPASLEQTLATLGPEKQRKISEVLALRVLDFPAVGSNGLDEGRLPLLAQNLAEVVRTLRERAQRASEVGDKNTRRYIGMPHLDVYVATSMRIEADYREQSAFIRAVFEDQGVKPLKLRYFDPTLSYVGDPVTKGLVECLMLRRARVTIYSAGGEDTFGKDSELAATLAQGKPVIVYVPAGPGFDSRARIFKEDHPLGLQLDVRTGVAHGIIVVRSPGECARMLRRVVLQELDLEILHEGGNYKLCEKETGSTLRVVPDDPYLTHAFWTYFHRPHG
jgi:hypothetical protein